MMGLEESNCQRLLSTSCYGVSLLVCLVSRADRTNSRGSCHCEHKTCEEPACAVISSFTSFVFSSAAVLQEWHVECTGQWGSSVSTMQHALNCLSSSSLLLVLDRHQRHANARTQTHNILILKTQVLQRTGHPHRATSCEGIFYCGCCSSSVLCLLDAAYSCKTFKEPTHI